MSAPLPLVPAFMRASRRQRAPAGLVSCLSCLVLLLVGNFELAIARDQDALLSQYAHTAWRLQDGVLPGAPRAIAQTADGYLWVGTSAGLLRFDGVKFVPFAPPGGERLRSPEVVSLLAARDGSLWIG